MDDTEAQVARARVAFSLGLKEATEAGGRAVRHAIKPTLWGVALLGGALALVAIVRLSRRRSRNTVLVHSLVQVVVPPRRSERALIPALGAALARLALERLLSAAEVSLSSLESVHAGPAPKHGGSERLGASAVRYDSNANGQLETIG